MKRPIPLNTLRAFEAVGRHCHVRRAAEELHLTHAALSRQVRILEEQLGTSLFTREKNRMQLTAAGRRFLSVVQDALDTLQEGVLHLNPESLAGELVVAITPTISINWLPGVIKGFAARYPEVELRFVTIEPHQRKLPQQFDLALCLGQPEVQGKAIRKLYQEYYFPVAAPSLVSPDKHYGFQSIEAARAGLGVVLADQLEVAADLRRGTLVRLLDEVMPVDAGIFLVCDQEETQTIRARLFIEELSRHLEGLGNSGDTLLSSL